MTPLGRLNYFILQWFWIRLVKRYDDGDGVGWSVMIGVAPMTGWGGAYWPREPRLLNLN